MKKIKKLVSIGLAVGTILSMLALTGCGEKNESENPADQQFAKSSSQQNDSDTIKSRVTSADSTARAIRDTINTWSADNIIAGGTQISDGTITVIADNGNVTVSPEPTKSDKNPSSLKETFEDDYASHTFWAKVFIDSDGKCVYTIYVDSFTSVNEDELPTKSDFENGTFAWKDEEHIGMTRSGLIVGTIPKLMIKK